MVQLFRKNWFVFTLLLFPYTILTRIWIFFDKPQWPIDIESHTMVYKSLEQHLPDQYIPNVILASFLVFINAVHINHIVIKNRIAREINLFPGMVFILLSSMHKDLFWISPQLISITFLLIAISNIFRIYQKPKASIYFFNTGLLIGLASLFYIPYTMFLLFIFITVFNLRKLQIRDFIQILTGLLLVVGFVSFFRFWGDKDFTPFLDFKDQLIVSFKIGRLQLNEIIIIIMILIMILLSILNYRKFTIKKSIQSQKKVNLIYWFMVFSLVSLIYGMNVFLFPNLLILFIPLSIFIAMLMNRYKNEASIELIHIFLLFFIIFSHFWF